MRMWWDNKIAEASTEELIAAAKDPFIYFVDLTFILEALGDRHDRLDAPTRDRVQELLLDGLKNEHALVREGSIYGLWDFVARPVVYAAVARLVKEDQSKTIREVALSVLQQWMSEGVNP